MYTLNFPDGRSQTYPNESTLQNAARAMGGSVQYIGQKIYVFVPKK